MCLGAVYSQLANIINANIENKILFLIFLIIFLFILDYKFCAINLIISSDAEIDFEETS